MCSSKSGATWRIIPGLKKVVSNHSDRRYPKPTNSPSKWPNFIACQWEVLTTWNPNDLYFWRSTPQNKAELPIKTRDPSWVPGTYCDDPPSSFIWLPKMPPKVCFVLYRANLGLAKLVRGIGAHNSTYIGVVTSQTPCITPFVRGPITPFIYNC